MMNPPLTRALYYTLSIDGTNFLHELLFFYTSQFHKLTIIIVDNEFRYAIFLPLNIHFVDYAGRDRRGSTGYPPLFP